LAKPYLTRTFTLQEAPSFSWRTHGKPLHQSNTLKTVFDTLTKLYNFSQMEIFSNLLYKKIIIYLNSWNKKLLK